MAAMRITIVMCIILGGEGITGEKTVGAGPRIIVDRIKAMMITVAGDRITVDRIKAMTITVAGDRITVDRIKATTTITAGGPRTIIDRIRQTPNGTRITLQIRGCLDTAR
jgi:hypothetical protein